MNHSDPFRLDGRTALVTGGTQGVGAAIARALAAAGAKLILHGLADDQAARKTCDECTAYGVQCQIVTADLAGPQPDTTARLLEQVDAIDDSVDLLVNNAGVFIDQPFLQMEPERFQRTMQINVAAGFFLTQALAQRWVRNKVAGRVLFTGSINGILAEPDHVAYDCSKGALAAMVRSLCVALAPQGIRVNSMAPGLVRSPLTNSVIDDPAFENWMRLHTPAGEVPPADVCGPPAVFLLSDAAGHVHGQTLLVDGGMSVWQQPDMPENLHSLARGVDNRL
ncbi:SDR family NAD(P)-dependent oxidoreductase [Roseimaritima ulvae]|uniref:3-oxoacyl-[acyl-carrier-protein] reductase FabG n=1 Tax=Roseimaritima ulvae TaxID=980254 RepID=A0A5B9QZ51_9BACT|nr:SDR family oxidoreductase [Roseimaritima ulvae]QEG42446.1 3-oxoacyl-[acyl-carrier-protein] reductase FabG [Roseimaritima ulvae]